MAGIRISTPASFVFLPVIHRHSAGPGHPGGQVTVTSCQKEKQVYLSVEDTGSGIPPELRERVFDPFFRVDKSRSRELGGVGLGLALVREIVKVHDGIITIQPNPAGGTIFEVVFARQNFLDKQDHKQ